MVFTNKSNKFYITSFKIVLFAKVFMSFVKAICDICVQIIQQAIHSHFLPEPGNFPNRFHRW